MMWFPIHAINLNLLQVKGRSDLFFRLEVIKKIIGVLIMFITIPNGIIWMVSGGIVSSMFALVINTYYTGKLINVGYFNQMRDLIPIFGVSIVMWGFVHMSFMLSRNIYVQISFGICVGIIVYIILSKIFLMSEWDDVMSMIPDKFKRKSYKRQTVI